MTTLKIVEKMLVIAKPTLKNNVCSIFCEKDNITFFIAVNTIDYSVLNISLFDNGKQIFITEEVKNFAVSLIKMNLENATVKTFPAVIFCDIYAYSEKEAEVILDTIVSAMKANFHNDPKGKIVKDDFLHIENYTANPSLN